MADQTERRRLCAGAQDEANERTRSLFAQVWAVPRDTYITEDFPLLLTRLSLLPDGTGRAPDAEPDSERR